MDDRQKHQVAKERERIKAAQKLQRESDDPIVRVIFRNLEDPTAPGKPSPPLSFTFNGHTFKESKKEEIPDTALRDGQEYDLPLSVVEHLNSLTIPVSGTKRDPITGGIQTYDAGTRARFACTTVNMGQYQRVDKPGTVKGKQQPPKSTVAAQRKGVSQDQINTGLAGMNPA